MQNMNLNKKCYTRNQPVSYEKIQIHQLEFHKTSIQLDHGQDIIDLYDKFNIYLPEKIINSCFKRQSEYFIGRLAAQYALKSLNPKYDFILKNGRYGEPIWPESCCGSISHSMCCAKNGVAIASLNQAQFVGIDIELKSNHSVLNDDKNILNQFLSSFEIKYLDKFLKSNLYLYLIIFSAKESIIKAICSKFKFVLSFKEIEIISINTTTQQMIFNLKKSTKS